MAATSTGIFKGVDQIGIVVKDLQAAMKCYVERYGVGPWYVIKFGPENVQGQTLHGKKKNYSHRLAICQIGNVQFELIESLSDTIYREHLNRYGEGVVHHVKMMVDDQDEAMKFFQSKRIEVLQTGNWEGKSRYANLATEAELGFQVEISVPSPGFKMPEPDYWYPADRKMLGRSIFKGVDQIGIVVKDLQAAMKCYVERYGVGPWYVIKFGPENVQDQTLHGKKKNYSHRLAICQIGNVQFELIESLSDTIYREHLNRCGEGVVHHVKMMVDDQDEAMKFFQSKRIEVLQTGNWEGKSRYANLATEAELGFQVEISVPSPGFKMPEPNYWYPADRKMVMKGGD